jgi:hypothetical protein
MLRCWWREGCSGNQSAAPVTIQRRPTAQIPRPLWWLLIPHRHSSNRTRLRPLGRQMVPFRRSRFEIIPHTNDRHRNLSSFQPGIRRARSRNLHCLMKSCLPAGTGRPQITASRIQPVHWRLRRLRAWPFPSPKRLGDKARSSCHAAPRCPPDRKLPRPAPAAAKLSQTSPLLRKYRLSRRFRD